MVPADANARPRVVANQRLQRSGGSQILRLLASSSPPLVEPERYPTKRTNRLRAMANEQYAFLRRSELPTTTALQSTLDSDPNFTLTIDAETDLTTAVGFVPCVICGVESGVEIDFDDSSELLGQFGAMVSDRDCCLVFRWGGDMAECACAMVLSYALAKYYNAIVSYEGEPPPDSLDAFRDETVAVHGHAKLTLP